MVQELWSDRYGSILFDPEDSLLELVWSVETASMTDEDFMSSMTRYASLAEQYRPRRLLVDVRDFRHAPGEQVAAWRDETIIPRYNSAGVIAFAFLVPADTPGTGEGLAPAVEAPGRFPTGYFGTREHALAWFHEL